MFSYLELFTRHFRQAGIALAMCFSPSIAAHADSWLPPETRTYLSEDATFKLTIIPKNIGSALEYFDQKVANDPTLEIGYLPAGILERSDAQGGWTELWHTQLVNEVSPVSAVISEDGEYVATFDNWHSMGWGDDVIAVYGKGGSTLYTYSLTDLIPDYYLKSLPRTVSSLNWSCWSDTVPERNHRFLEDKQALIVSLRVPTKERRNATECVDLAISLTDGKVRTNDPAFQNVLPSVQEVFQIQDQARQARDDAFRAPLFPPKDPESRRLHQYLVEAFFRISPSYADGYPATKLVRSETSPDYDKSMRWLTEGLLSRPSSTSPIMVATPDQTEDLIAALKFAMSEVPEGHLSNSQIYVLAPKVFKDEIEEIISYSGAELVLLDPSIGIPQRQERLNLRFGDADSN